MNLPHCALSDASVKRVARRYADAKEIESSGADRREWQTSAGRVYIELRGSKVLVLEYVPTKMDLESVIKTCWAAV